MGLRIGWHAVLGLLAAAALFPGGAGAATLTNRDGREHTLTIGAAPAAETLVLKDGQTADGICIKGCLIRLGGPEGEEYVLEKGDIVSIEDGKLYYDEPGTASGVAPVPSQSAPPLRGER